MIINYYFKYLLHEDNLLHNQLKYFNHLIKIFFSYFYFIQYLFYPNFYN
jgi:hypothetical protein